jgi:hypothetical protein
MKTPRRSSKVVTDTTPVTGIPVSDAKALFDAVSQDNTKHITLGVPRALGETEVSDQEDPQNEAVLPDESPELDLNLENVIDRAFEAAGLPVDTTTDQLVNQAVEQMNAEGIDFDALLEQGTAMMEQLMAGIDPSGPTIPGTIEMDIEQDDGTIKHHVFDNLDRPYHTTAMNYCDLLIQQYDRDKADRALQPPVKPLRAKFFGFF